MPRITLTDMWGVRWDIASNDPETIERWFSEMLANLNDSNETALTVQFYPIFWDANTPDWPADGSLNYMHHVFSANSGREAMARMEEIRGITEKEAKRRAAH